MVFLVAFFAFGVGITLGLALGFYICEADMENAEDAIEKLQEPQEGKKPIDIQDLPKGLI